MTLLLGVGGVLSHWWLPFVHAADAAAGYITTFGGALLVIIQVTRWLRSFREGGDDRAGE